MGLLLGLLLFQSRAPLMQLSGLLLGVPCAAALSVRAGLVLRQWQRERECEAAKAAKQIRQAERRRRGLQRREQQTQQQAVAAQAAQKRRAAEAQRRQTEQEHEEADAQRRTERESQTRAEAERWQAMEAQAFRDELAALLRRRGLAPMKHTPEGFLGAGEIALLVTEAQEADVETLEQSRRECGAQRAYLIARHGFAFEAVRRVRDFPAITLVESFLLAEWSLHRPSQAE